MCLFIYFFHTTSSISTEREFPTTEGVQEKISDNLHTRVRITNSVRLRITHCSVNRWTQSPGKDRKPGFQRGEPPEKGKAPTMQGVPNKRSGRSPRKWSQIRATESCKTQTCAVLPLSCSVYVRLHSKVPENQAFHVPLRLGGVV